MSFRPSPSPTLAPRTAVRIVPAEHDGRLQAAAQDPWGELMAAAQGGNGGAYRRLLGEVSVSLEHYFRRRLPRADVDDAVQDTLLAIHRRRHTYDPRHPLGPWLMAIAKRKWIDQLRGLARRAAEGLTDEIAVPGHEAAVIDASVLAKLIQELRPAQAQVILLVKLQGYSIEEASRETGQSPSAVKVNIHRGLARLTAFVEKQHDVD